MHAAAMLAGTFFKCKSSKEQQTVFSKTLFFRVVCSQRETKGQQLKGKVVSEFFTLFHTLQKGSEFFPPGLSPSKQRVLAQ